KQKRIHLACWFCWDRQSPYWRFCFNFLLGFSNYSSAARCTMATSPILRTPPATLRRHRSRAAEQTSLTFSPAARPGNCEPRGDARSPLPAVATPEAEHPAELVGIARLAASSPRAEAKRGTEYFLLPVRSILNHCEPKHVPFNWTINPYRGCEFGCRYCYARYTHEFMELDGDEFEKKIFVKQNSGPLVSRDLAAGRKGIWRHARDPRKNGRTRRPQPLDHHQIESRRARYRLAPAHRRALV